MEPLILKIGNSLLSDTINCFDQLSESLKVRIKNNNLSTNIPKKARFGVKRKFNFFNILTPPFISICSLILFSSAFIYFYNPAEYKERNELINPKYLFNVALTTKTIVGGSF